MNILYLDAFSGISGDMMLGLLVDLGVPLKDIEADLSRLPVSGYRLTSKQEKRHGIGGTRVEVLCEGKQSARTWSDIDQMLTESSLPGQTRELARKIFRILGDAEARVHQINLEKVHFHEVGAVDAIVDIVGTAAGLTRLNLDRIVCSPLPLSSGLINASHGIVPLPAPATLEILRGCPVRAAGSTRELVTPTGAAIASAVAGFGQLPAMVPDQVGYGVGGWQLEDRPNLLRGVLGRSGATDGLEQDTAVVLETHIDDMSPELLGSLLEKLMNSGAWDAGFTPLQMKKNRPGVRVTVVTSPGRKERLARLLLRESTATGVRSYETSRLKLRREIHTVPSSLGKAQVKLAFEGETLLRITPEHASCAALAEATGRPLSDVYRIITETANRQFGLEE
ncbi:MAG: nickel pincer cofactor biosynthesis protein LarC [Desulfuromonadales bacterium]|nr:nickel pincer cofactor biosynthesis protein LarC [Desulfuromonadales bacterium]